MMWCCGAAGIGSRASAQTAWAFLGMNSASHLHCSPCREAGSRSRHVSAWVVRHGKLGLHAGVGEVHDGLWAGLHQLDPASAAGHLVVDRILHCLQDVSQQKQIFMCGHSLGGGLVTMLSLILPTRRAQYTPSVENALPQSYDAGVGQ